MSADLHGNSSDTPRPADQPQPASQPHGADHGAASPASDQAAGAEAREQKYAHLTGRPDQASRPEPTGSAAEQSRGADHRPAPPTGDRAAGDRAAGAEARQQKYTHLTGRPDHASRPDPPARNAGETGQAPSPGAGPRETRLPDGKAYTDHSQATDAPHVPGKPPAEHAAQGTEHANGTDRQGTRPYPELPQQQPAGSGAQPDGTAIPDPHRESQGTNTDSLRTAQPGSETAAAEDRPQLPGAVGDSGNNPQPAEASASHEKTENTSPPASQEQQEHSGNNSDGAGNGPDRGDGGNGEDGGPDGPKPPDGPDDGDHGETTSPQDKIIAQQEKIISIQEKMIDRLEGQNDKLRDENDKLRARVAEAEGSGRTSAEDKSPLKKPVQDHTKIKSTTDRSWYKKLPGRDAIAVGVGSATLSQAIAMNAHYLSKPTDGIIAAGIGLGAAAYTLTKNKIEKHWEKKKNANRPQD